MRIYRIECEQGRGPWSSSGAPGSYVAGSLRYDDCKDDSVPSCYAGPCGEVDCKTYGDFDAWQEAVRADTAVLHGCVNLTQLEQWFQCPNGRAAMEAHGFHGTVYEVDRKYVRFGSAQVLFLLDHATPVGSFDLKTLTEMDHA